MNIMIHVHVSILQACLLAIIILYIIQKLYVVAESGISSSLDLFLKVEIN